MSMNEKVSEILYNKTLYHYDFDLITGIIDDDIVDKDGNNYTHELGLVSPCTFDEMMVRSYDEKYFGVLHVTDSGVNTLSQQSLLEEYNKGRDFVEALIYSPKFVKYYRLNYYLVKDDLSGNPHVYVSCVDITDEENRRKELFGVLCSAKDELHAVLESFASVFYSLHELDLVKDEVIEFNARGKVKEITSQRKCGAVDLMSGVMSSVVADEYKDAALEFTDLTTVADRMMNKDIMSEEFVGKNIGWFLSTLLVMERDEMGRPTKIVHATRAIDSEKKEKEKLIRSATTDELTGLLNRRAYEEEVYKNNCVPEEDEFVYISLDVNGLKLTNDTKGHEAGDELLVGASECMEKVFGPHGHVYRTGGDEFVAVLFVDSDRIKSVLDDFDIAVSNWKGTQVDELSISYGYVSKKDFPGLTIRRLSMEAEKKMYEAKSSHYRKKGVDRRGQQDAHRVLCGLYTKILKINLTEDSYQVINMNVDEKTDPNVITDTMSSWFLSFGKAGYVHPDDLEEYLKYTDINYMKDYFAGNKTTLHVFYRRKEGDEFKQYMMETVPADDYRDDNQSVFLYIKNIDK